MTAPNYTDEHMVENLGRGDLLTYAESADRGLFTKDRIANTIISNIVKTALSLWEARDSARAAAALQDEAIHKALPRTHALEEIANAVTELIARGVESKKDFDYLIGPMLEEKIENLDALTAKQPTTPEAKS